MVGLPIIWLVDSEFDDSEIKSMLEEYGFKKKLVSNEHIKWLYHGLNLSIVRYPNKILVQGKESEDGLNLLQKLNNFEYLRLDKKNAQKFAKLFKTQPNAIYCGCGKESLLIKGEIDELNIVFKMEECGHKNDLNPPLFMLTCRLLPDINILVGNHLSRLIDLGYFSNFEIVIPKFIGNVMDILGKNKQAGISREIDKLRKQERENKITIFNCNDNRPIPSKEEIDQEEDNIILEIANLTNSILFTADENLKIKATIDKRPTIYIHPQDANKIKFIAETEN